MILTKFNEFEKLIYSFTATGYYFLYPSFHFFNKKISIRGISRQASMASFLKPKTDKPDIPDCQDENAIFFMYELELQVHLLTFLLEKIK